VNFDIIISVLNLFQSAICSLVIDLKISELIIDSISKAVVKYREDYRDRRRRACP